MSASASSAVELVSSIFGGIIVGVVLAIIIATFNQARERKRDKQS